jgi:hypothetical protein
LLHLLIRSIVWEWGHRFLGKPYLVCTISDIKGVLISGDCWRNYQVKARANNNHVEWYFRASLSLENDPILDNFLDSRPIQINVGLVQSCQIVRINDYTFATRSYSAAVECASHASLISQLLTVSGNNLIVEFGWRVSCTTLGSMYH